jgi:hypothetical protein
MVANVSTIISSIGGSSVIVQEQLSRVTEYLNEKKCPAALENEILNQYRRQGERSQCRRLGAHPLPPPDHGLDRYPHAAA